MVKKRRWGYSNHYAGLFTILIPPRKPQHRLSVTTGFLHFSLLSNITFFLYGTLFTVLFDFLQRGKRDTSCTCFFFHFWTVGATMGWCRKASISLERDSWAPRYHAVISRSDVIVAGCPCQVFRCLSVSWIDHGFPRKRGCPDSIQ